ncbi:hypothetical protein QYE76_055619 [Lolium multiflorum]|uniref:Uncharacterized protein n=1 Tax=Lolium multiflorum TaxID=4521 RepID=A0AAD8T0X0_LOLMU|nr:hypothetical protein QYE76_055619 [Lolium multiflorum]
MLTVSAHTFLLPSSSPHYTRLRSSPLWLCSPTSAPASTSLPFRRRGCAADRSRRSTAMAAVIFPGDGSLAHDLVSSAVTAGVALGLLRVFEELAKRGVFEQVSQRPHFAPLLAPKWEFGFQTLLPSGATTSSAAACLLSGEQFRRRSAAAATTPPSATGRFRRVGRGGGRIGGGKPAPGPPGARSEADRARRVRSDGAWKQAAQKWPRAFARRAAAEEEREGPSSPRGASHDGNDDVDGLTLACGSSAEAAAFEVAAVIFA